MDPNLSLPLLPARCFVVPRMTYDALLLHRRDDTCNDDNEQAIFDVDVIIPHNLLACQKRKSSGRILSSSSIAHPIVIVVIVLPSCRHWVISRSMSRIFVGVGYYGALSFLLIYEKNGVYKIIHYCYSFSYHCIPQFSSENSWTLMKIYEIRQDDFRGQKLTNAGTTQLPMAQQLEFQ